MIRPIIYYGSMGLILILGAIMLVSWMKEQGYCGIGVAVILLLVVMKLTKE